ncbi:hypothetical protein BRARA_I03505 [Brassica rapa]|uniref:Uncharacterized protein n=2 Tax=Brassica TaxID=3705 RepID=M4CRN1_BRACM|nr:hypothetical protein BRARA_I03505 [Brassica rapa]CAF2046847.1 unnamed protein product [Brassica napus]
MKSIAFSVLLLLAVATSGNMLNGWQNLTGVHEDGEEVIWVSLVLDQKNYITYPALNRPPVCKSSMNHLCTPIYSQQNSQCTIYNRCKHGSTGSS